MNTPTHRYTQLGEARMADLKLAAETGKTWDWLADLWKMERTSAAEWSRQRDKDLSAQISRNGGGNPRGRPPKGFSHNVTTTFAARKAFHVFCNHWHLKDGRVEQCGAPTLKGHHACPSCSTLEGKGTGRRLLENLNVYL